MEQGQNSFPGRYLPVHISTVPRLSGVDFAFIRDKTLISFLLGPEKDAPIVEGEHDETKELKDLGIDQEDETPLATGKGKVILLVLSWQNTTSLNFNFVDLTSLTTQPDGLFYKNSFHTVGSHISDKYML